jgi:hypothetical protein
VCGDTMLENGSDTGHDFQTLSNLRIDVDAITEKLQADGKHHYLGLRLCAGRIRKKARENVSNSRYGMIAAA